MNVIFTAKRNTPVYLIFFYSILAHILLVLLVALFLRHPLKELEKQNNVYIQIVEAPQSVAIPKKELQKPKPKPKPKQISRKILKKTPLKRRAQQQPTSKAAPLVQEQPELKPSTSSPNPPISQDTARAEAQNVVATKAVVEAVVDKAARCKIPEITLTQDAANAGVTSGKVVLEVQISTDGKVTEAKLLKGTGFKIDDAVIKLAKKMDCIPAEKDGKNIAVIKRLQWLIQR